MTRPVADHVAARYPATVPASNRAHGRTEAAETVTVATWTLVSRVTGLLRIAVAGAVLGPTFFANIFQATNTIPNLTYNLLAGSLLTTLIVPSLVGALNRHGIDGARRLVRGLVGVMVVGFCAAGLAVIALGPLIVQVLTIGIPGGRAAAEGRAQAWVLLLLVVPQIGLYGLAAIGAAAQNAERRFALAAAAPAVENVGLVATLLLAASWFGSGLDTSAVPTGYLVILGIGSTASVAAHAGLQVLGAARVGLPLWPSWGWHDPEVRDVLRRAVPTIGTATADAGWLFAVIVAAGTVPGGVVAMQIGIKLYNLPLALSARAIGTVLLPRLAQAVARSDLDTFRRTYERGLSRAWFITMPAAVALVCLAYPISEVLAFGELHRANSVELMTVAVATLAPALVGAATYEIARQASYAHLDARTPFLAGVAQVAFILAGVAAAIVAFDGIVTIAVLGLAVSLGNLVRAVLVDHAVRRTTTCGTSRSWSALIRNLFVAVVTVGPAALLAHVAGELVAGKVGAVAAIGLGAITGLVAYLAAQAAMRAPELDEIRRRERPRNLRVPLTSGEAA
jgi:putative peptidoglycan lipid II flippase